jgi:probable phosphoglycerate mutase
LAERLITLISPVPGTVPVFVSPTVRTIETAWPIAEALGGAPEVSAEFNEFPLGAWVGRSFRELRQEPEFSAYFKDPVQHPMGSGTFVHEVAARVEKATATALASGRGPIQVVVTHGGIIKLAVAAALGIDLRHYNRIECDEGSISAIQYRDDAEDQTWPRVVLLNEKR